MDSDDPQWTEEEMARSRAHWEALDELQREAFRRRVTAAYGPPRPIWVR